MDSVKKTRPHPNNSDDYKALFMELLVFRILRDLKRDWGLFIDRKQVEKRNRYWHRRITRYAIDAEGLQYKDGIFGTHRIDFTSHLLGVLDSKFSTLLQFLSLFGLMVGVWNRTDEDSDGEVFWWISFSFWIAWVLAAITCFRGGFRVAWNEPRSVNTQPLNVWNTEHKKLQEHVEFEKLVRSLVRRTAWFRIAAVQLLIVAMLGVTSIAYDLFNIDQYLEDVSKESVVSDTSNMAIPELLFLHGETKHQQETLGLFHREIMAVEHTISGYVLIEPALVPNHAEQEIKAENDQPTKQYILSYTGDSNDRVSGFLYEVSIAELDLLDAHAGSQTERRAIDFLSDKQIWVYRKKISQ
ncbi:hypothetical protein MIB92_17055 [Aestuariirhabdus sp. Z084]|uniref:hypothetical protein n=1 Tax=Aestuariirhabdus haliotis TaxID=2918751 RepID=UPI00201B356D|nr:hypothetical protein [Aestuariirhabdus haliotis]MCL6417371.1 hypothetical protein [Aestuariirhabdus haliotis]MCL6421332.1 hypothetical protein [Aestuariirhabdus haliotis]